VILIIIGKNMRDLLFNPNLFFSAKSKNMVNLKYPILIILINSIIITSSYVFSAIKMRGLFSSNESLVFSDVLNINFILNITIEMLILSFAYWIILTVIFYLISSILNSKGSFMKTLEFVGYGFTPLILSNIVDLLVFYIIIASLNVSSSDPQSIGESFNQLNHHLSPVSQIFTIICVLWSAYIWIFALLHARNISKKNAILTVGIPLGLYLVIGIYLKFGVNY
jgi:hypothetical protein